MKDNGIYIFNYEKLTIRDTKSKETLNKKLKSVKKYLTNGTFLGYHYSIPKIEEIIEFLEKDRNVYKISYSDNLGSYNEISKGYDHTLVEPYTELEGRINELFVKIKDKLQVEDYKENRKSKKIQVELEAKIKEFVEETHLSDQNVRKKYIEDANNIKRLLKSTSFISTTLLKPLIKKQNELILENEKNYQNLYLRNWNRHGLLESQYEGLKTFFSERLSELIKLQFDDVKKLLSSENYNNFEDASDILDKVEDEYETVLREKKERIFTYLRTQVDGLKGYVWEEDFEIIRNGSETIISEAVKSNDFNNLNLDKFRTDEKIHSKKNRIDVFIKYLIDSSNDTKREHKAKLATIIKQSETFYARDISEKEFEEFTKNSKMKLEGRDPKSGFKSKYQTQLRVILIVLFLVPSIFLIRYNASSSKEYNSRQGEKYLKYVVTLVKSTRKTGAELDKSKIRKRISVPAEDLRILNMTDSTVTIDYKGHVLRSVF